MKVELDIARLRRIGEKKLVRRINDSYGRERIAAMEAEIRAEYAAKMADEEFKEAAKNESVRYVNMISWHCYIFTIFFSLYHSFSFPTALRVG
jgi:hypothetical protein